VTAVISDPELLLRLVAAWALGILVQLFVLIIAEEAITDG
jgi:hypothetical protein